MIFVKTSILRKAISHDPLNFRRNGMGGPNVSYNFTRQSMEEGVPLHGAEVGLNGEWCSKSASV